jgi:periplasmic protein CpxP/Spy
MSRIRIGAPGAALTIALLGAAALCAQPAGGRGPGQGPRGAGGPPPAGAPGRVQPGPGRGAGQVARPPVERTFGKLPQGRFWTDPALVSRLGLTADQQKQMDAVFQQNRPKLIDLNATLQKAEVALEPLLNVDRPDEARTMAQIDRVAEARAELEKANARMLLGLRAALTPDQWKTLQANPARQPMQGGPGPGGPGGPGRFEEED